MSYPSLAWWICCTRELTIITHYCVCVCVCDCEVINTVVWSVVWSALTSLYTPLGVRRIVVRGVCGGCTAVPMFGRTLTNIDYYAVQLMPSTNIERRSGFILPRRLWRSLASFSPPMCTTTATECMDGLITSAGCHLSLPLFIQLGERPGSLQRQSGNGRNSSQTRCTL